MPFSFDAPGNAWVNEPNPYIVRNLLNEVGVPAWNPSEGLGMPFIANLNNEALNPLKFFLNLFPHPYLQDIFFLMRLLIAGFFTCLFLKEMRLSPVSSLLGGVFFMLSGYSVWWINLHPLSTVIYFPAVFYCYERWSERRETQGLFFMSLCLALSLIAGKMPDVVMGLSLLILYALWKGAMRDSLRGMLREGCGVLAGTVSGILMASVVILPFLELYSLASPVAKAIRTGSGSHTIPLMSSVTLVQPLFLGWGNYFYGSWMKWTPEAVLPHAGIVITLLSLYAIVHGAVLKMVFPFFLFSLFLFCAVFGLLPSHLVAGVPVLGGIGLLKYNAMLYFSLAVMAAAGLNQLLSLESSRKKFYLSAAATGIAVLIYFLFLYGRSPLEMRGYMIAVLALSLGGIAIISATLALSVKRQRAGILLFLVLLAELFLYMPKDHPDRDNPYREPSYLRVIRDESPYRISGTGNAVPPLVSNAMGLHDIRAISVLLPGSYYSFFENLLGFSLPGTSSPNALFTATSPFNDLAGVKYILSGEPLQERGLRDEIRAHIGSLRLVRLTEAMIRHSIEGSMTFGTLHHSGETRTSLFFPGRFSFRMEMKVSEPFLFAGFALKDGNGGGPARVSITVQERSEELTVPKDGWRDHWIDVSQYLGKVIAVSVEGGSGNGKIVLGNFGLSPGPEREKSLYDSLLSLHSRELDSLKYRGIHGGIHIYENENVMDRAFVLRETMPVGGIEEAIKMLQEGADFRKVALVSDMSRIQEVRKHRDGSDSVVIKKYSASQVLIDVESKGGLLVLSDLFYPGWKVRVNGKEERIIRTFGLLRGVFIGEGKSEVLFSYEPASLSAGAIISTLTFAVWICYFLCRRKQRVGPDREGATAA